MNRRAYRRGWNRQKDKYEKRGSAIFRKHLRKTALYIPFDRLTLSTYRAYVVNYIQEETIKDAYVELYQTIGKAHGTRIGRAINKEIRAKNFTPLSFENLLGEFIANLMRSYTQQRIPSVKEELSKYIIDQIADGVEEGLSMNDIVRRLQTVLRGRRFYDWQIERIVRTETTAAANAGASLASTDSGIAYEKEWISANDSRTRRRPRDSFDHLEMDGRTVDPNQRFELRGNVRGIPVVDHLRFPGDPEARFPGSVINCRCTVATVPKRDENGRLIFI